MRSIMAMLRPTGADAASLYDSLVAEARRKGWYLDGGVPDSLDGRFAVLSSLVALAILRLESGDEAAVRSSVALTEAFISDMDAQMRQAGFGDPSLGKQVRSMVGSLASRVDRFRQTIEADSGWSEAAAASVHRGEPASEAAATYAAEQMRRVHEMLGGASDRAVIAGHWQ